MNTPSQRNWFGDRPAILATMHRKEQVIAPLMQEAFGIEVTVLSNFNTDAFGTFTRDIARAGSQREAARLKARSILEITGATLAIASEGAFFPHPAIPMIPCDRELVLLHDAKHDFEVVGEALSTDTNFAHTTVNTVEGAIAFAQKAGFPDHGLVVMTHPNATGAGEIFKGLTTYPELTDAVERAIAQSPNQTAHVETDMRALYNPTRMGVIAEATRDLIQKLQQYCPECGYPGFGITKQFPGLPCRDCRTPTLLIRAELYQCVHCRHQQTQPPAHGLTFAEPAQCAYCNP